MPNLPLADPVANDQNRKLGSPPSDEMPRLKTRSSIGLHSSCQRLILWVCEDAFLRREDTVGVGNLRYHFEEFAFDIDRRELRRGAEVVPITPHIAFEFIYRRRLWRPDDV